MKIRACAKINLGLNIVSKRPDGYHDLETVFYPVGIFDEIEIRERPRGCCQPSVEQQCTLSVAGQQVEGRAEDNLVVKAYHALAADHILPPVHISLTKLIPMQAGMGGGSADCAFTLRLLNEMFQLGLSVQQLQEYAARLGADCAFFINAQPAYAEGIGDRLYPVSLDLSDYALVIVKPSVAISTREAFSGVSVKKPVLSCRDIVMRPVEEWRSLLVNDFEESVFPLYPCLADIKEKLYSMGACYAAMSGSGSALFGLFKQAPKDLDNTFPDCFTAIV